ncbi:MAG: TonB-dependent receptor [Thermoanaerobaculia bacterium]|nr:TonB-dependent receptor [Thermoanaerobaculia bacterium]
MSRARGVTAGAAFAVVLAVATTPLAAQGDVAPATPTVETGDEAPTVRDAITVTAQKREESIQDVSQSITALDAETIETLTIGGADVKFLSARVPSLQIESSFGRAFPRFYIRGLGNTDFDLNASQPVSMVVDEVVLENPVVKGMPLFDLERIEVLRGPQGSLFGRNTPAGVVKFDTAKPSQDADGYVRASYGTFDSFDVKAAYGGAISETVSGRVAVLYQSQGDWVDNKFTGENDALGGHQTTAYRAQLLWQPNEKFDALFNLHGWDVDGTARIFRANILKSGSSDLVSGFEQDEVFHDGLNEQDISAFGGVLKLDYAMDGMTLTSITGYETLDMYSRGDIDGGFGAVFAPPSGPGFIPFPSESADGLPDLDQFTQEIRLASETGGRWDWLAGFYYFDESLQADSFSYNSLAPGNPQDGYAYQKQDATSWALFASLDYRPSDLWTIKGGLRYTTDEKDFSAERLDPTFQTPTIAPIRVETDADLVTWDLTATRHVNDTMNVYGRVGTGFRAPSVQGRILFCPDFEGGANFATNCVSVADEEEIFSTEVGFKSELMNRRLRLNMALYNYKVDGQQIVAVGGQFNTATLLNADTTDGYGLEADVQFAPSSHWLVTLGGSYNKTEIDDANLAVAPCGGGCTVLDPIVNGLARVDGNSLPHAPEITLNGILDYRRPIGEALFAASLDLAYHDEKSFFLYESKEFNGDSLELGLRLAYTFPEAKYEVGLFATNLLDEETVQNGIDFNNLTGMTNEPRKVGAEFVIRF